MKKLLLTFAAMASLGLAAEKPACCMPGGAAAPAAGAFTPRSLYHLDAGWTNDAGAAVRLDAFRGEPVVVAMIFAQCEYACPTLLTDLHRLRDKLPADARERTRFVLVSFDDVRDTPEALKAYRERMGLDEQWTLLHGKAADIRQLAMLLGIKYQRDARGQFSHSNLFTILNPEGEVVHQQLGLLGDVAPSVDALVNRAK